LQDCLGNDDNVIYCKKIIATNDESIVAKFGNDGEIYGKMKNGLPQIPQSFIQQFIIEYNKGNIITKVMVEYRNIVPQSEFEKNPEFYGTGMFNKRLPAISVLKINPDNTINIQPIKTSWSIEEVTELVLKAYNAGWNNYCDMIQGRCTGIYSKEFIEENL
jgi:hypothetical protein